MPWHTKPLGVAAQAAPAKHLQPGHAHITYMSQPFVCMNENTARASGEGEKNRPRGKSVLFAPVLRNGRGNY